MSSPKSNFTIGNNNRIALCQIKRYFSTQATLKMQCPKLCFKTGETGRSTAAKHTRQAENTPMKVEQLGLSSLLKKKTGKSKAGLTYV